MTKEELAKLGPKLRDPMWRLMGDAGVSPLYWIKDAKGTAVRFKPNEAQIKIIKAIYVQGLLNILIPKARQLGMSTVIALIMLDMMLFGAGVQGAIVDQTQKDATKKLKGKILFAFVRLPKVIRDKYQVLKANDSMLSVKLRGKDDDTASEVQAGMNARGDTFQILHVSEWGPIAFHDPPRSEEILTGAFPAAKLGIKIIETTWKGGKVGHLWDLTKEALEISDANRTKEDFTVFFFPWWGDPDYTLEGDARQIPSDCRKYLEETEAEIGKARGEPFKFTPGQRLWYYKKAWKLGLFRFQEYPSMLSECFRAPIEGAIYAELLDKARAEGRIGAAVADPSAKVNTSWDLGGPLNIVTWYFQMIGDELRFLDCDTGLDLTPSERVEHMRLKAQVNGWEFGFHFLPHDGAASKQGGRTIQAELEGAGLANTRIIPRTDDVWIGINHVRGMMARMTFASPACDEGLTRLETYHTGVWIEKGRQMDLPVHDKSSHAADALRTMGEADMAAMLEGGWVESAFSTAGLNALRTGGNSAAT